MAGVHGVNLATVSGTGPSGRVIKADIEDALQAAPLASPVQSASSVQSIPSFESVPGSGYVDI
jgi:pyruvate dehydrogenase E2 component (dihydrolipoamide acetyltransferase)